MTAIANWEFILSIVGLLVVLGYFIVTYICVQCGQKKKEYEWYDYGDFSEEHMILTIFMISLAIIFLICSIVTVIDVVNFRMQEGVQYATYLADYKSLYTAMDVTTDVVNTDLYLRIIDYNSEVTRMASLYNSRLFAISFSGHYDWSTLPIIHLY